MPTDIIVSVVIPCYNDGQFLLEAVESAEANRRGLHEIIVVDDGSNDPMTLKVLEGIEGRGHRVLHQENSGLGAARNRGIAIARGRYILPLDSDNHIRPEYIDRGVEILDNDSGMDVVYGDAEYFGGRTGRWRVPEFNLRRLLRVNQIDACAVFRRSAWERCGGYDEAMPIQGCEDWDLWIRIACTGGKFRHVNEVLFDYRVRSDSMSVQMRDPARHAAIVRHVRAKQIAITVGEYLDSQESWDSIIDALRHHPCRILVILLLRSYLPHAYSKLRNLRRSHRS